MNTKAIQSLKRPFIAGAIFLGTMLAFKITGFCQNFSIPFYSIDNGGGISAAGGFSLLSAIGQPDTSVSAAGGFTLRGGLWILAGEPGVPVGPQLRINRMGNRFVISWPVAEGFILQKAINLSQPANWTDVAASVVMNGAENAVTLPASGGSAFFRLQKPE